MHTTPEGYIHYPVRGKPPIREGYEPYNGNPFILQPILYPCDYREQRIVDHINKATNRPCCKKQVNWCFKQNKIVLRLECKDCKERHV